MRIFSSPGKTERDKFIGVIRSFPCIWDGSILDIGCRGGNLSMELSGKNINYVGLDIIPPANVIGNLEQGLPFNNNAFNTVVALDVLEHTDNIYKSFEELCRVSSNYILILLPNAYEIKTRINFVLGNPISGKYGLPIDPPVDRHKWIFSFWEAQRFCNQMAILNNFKIVSDGCFVGPSRNSYFGKRILGRYPELLAQWYLVLLERFQ